MTTGDNFVRTIMEATASEQDCTTPKPVRFVLAGKVPKFCKYFPATVCLVNDMRTCGSTNCHGFEEANDQSTCSGKSESTFRSVIKTIHFQVCLPQQRAKLSLLSRGATDIGRCHRCTFESESICRSWTILCIFNRLLTRFGQLRRKF